MATCKDCKKYKQCPKVYMYKILQRVCFEFKKQEG